MSNKLKFTKHPIYRNGELVYMAYVAMDYLDDTQNFDIYVVIKKRFFKFFWVKVHEASYRNVDPITATKKAIEEYENYRKKEKYQTHKVNVHMVNFMNWDGELEN